MPNAIKRRLVSTADILAAAQWRLAGWTHEEVEAGRIGVADILDCGAELDESNPSVACLLASLHRPDRREPWTAMCALIVLHAHEHGMTSLFFKSGFEVLSSWRNHRMNDGIVVSRSALTDMIESFLVNRPEATAGEVFDAFSAMAMMPTTDHRLESYDPGTQVITYWHGDRLRRVKRDSFDRQFRRVRGRRSK